MDITTIERPGEFIPPRSRKWASTGSPYIKKPASVSIALPLDLNKIVERILQKYSDRLGLTPEQATKMLETLRSQKSGE